MLIIYHLSTIELKQRYTNKMKLIRSMNDKIYAMCRILFIFACVSSANEQKKWKYSIRRIKNACRGYLRLHYNELNWSLSI